MLIWLASRKHSLLCLIVIALGALVLPRAGRAEQRSAAYLAEQLKSASDFRVRTQAALALGASDSQEAASPLCSALDDPNETVRGAAAAALGRLGRASSVPCLEKHAREPSAAVRTVIERSLASLRSGRGAAKPPPPKRDDTFYVAIGTVTDKTGRTDGSVPPLVYAAMQQKLLTMHGYAVAPSGEAAADARRVLQKHRLKGFLVQVRVEPLRQNGTNLTVQVRVTLWSYPDRTLLGEFSPKLTMSNVAPGDVESENELIRMALDKALESFAVVAASVN